MGSTRESSILIHPPEPVALTPQSTDIRSVSLFELEEVMYVLSRHWCVFLYSVAGRRPNP